MKIKDIINNKLIEKRLLTHVRNHSEIGKINARKLITSNRFDLLIKLNYLFYRDVNRKFATDCYDEHLKVFGAGRYVEPEKPYKNNLSAFLDEFDNLFLDLSENGFKPDRSVIPLARDGSILNGAHRVAAAAFLNIDVFFIKLDLPPSDYSYDFFKKNGMSWSSLYAAIEQLQLYKDRLRAMVIWPARNSDVKAFINTRIPSKYLEENYEINSFIGSKFVRQIYFNEPWLGSAKNGYEGAISKAEKCWREKNRLTLILFDNEEDLDLVDLKAEVRNLFGLGKHSLHISDGVIDTQDAWRPFLNRNFLDFSKLEKKKCSFLKDHKLQKLSEFMNGLGVDNNEYCVTSSMLMEIAGLRIACDVDVSVCLTKNTELNFDKSSDIKLDISKDKFKSIQIDDSDLLYDPANYFWYNRMKIMSPSKLYNYKTYLCKTTNSKKDCNDKKLLSLNYKEKKLLENVRIKIYFYRRRLSTNLKQSVRVLLIKLGMFNLIKNLLKK